MINEDQPGHLDSLFEDDSTDLPANLAWPAVGDSIISASSSTSPRHYRWLWLTGSVILAVVGFYFLFHNVSSDESQSGSEVNIFATTITSKSSEGDLPSITGIEKEPLASKTHTGFENVNTVPLVTSGPDAPTNSVSFNDNAMRRRTGRTTLLGGDMVRGEAAIDAAFATPATVMDITGRPSDNGMPTVRKLPAVISPILRMWLPGIFPTDSLSSLEPNADDLLPTVKDYKEATAHSHFIDLALGSNRAVGIPDQYTPLWRPHLAASYRVNTPGGFTYGVGLRYNQTAWRSDLNATERVSLYRPGTVDTVYVNLSTGQERIITTDSVPGIRTTQFEGYAKVSTFGLSLQAGYAWPVLGGRFTTFLTADPTFTFQQNGRSLTGRGEIVQVRGSDLITDGFYLNLTANVRYERRFGERISVFGEGGYGWSPNRKFFLPEQPVRLGQFHTSVGIGVRLK